MSADAAKHAEQRERERAAHAHDDVGALMPEHARALMEIMDGLKASHADAYAAACKMRGAAEAGMVTEAQTKAQFGRKAVSLEEYFTRLCVSLRATVRECPRHERALAAAMQRYGLTSGNKEALRNAVVAFRALLEALVAERSDAQTNAHYWGAMAALLTGPRLRTLALAASRESAAFYGALQRAARRKPPPPGAPPAVFASDGSGVDAAVLPPGAVASEAAAAEQEEAEEEDFYSDKSDNSGDDNDEADGAAIDADDADDSDFEDDEEDQEEVPSEQSFLDFYDHCVEQLPNAASRANDAALGRVRGHILKAWAAYKQVYDEATGVAAPVVRKKRKERDELPVPPMVPPPPPPVAPPPVAPPPVAPPPPVVQVKVEKPYAELD